jgi:hypothetical protein
VQLDRTQIAIRERGLSEILDLSLHVLRAYAGPLAISLLIGAAPLMLLNHFLIGWMAADLGFRESFSAEDYGRLVRYIWNMILLVLIQAPLMSVFATSYLGQAVFLERPRIGAVVRDVCRMLPQLAWRQVMLRGVGPACLLIFTLDRRSEFDILVEAFLLPALAVYAVLLRAVRPFMNEIILLERNPLRARQSGDMTVGRRSLLLHSPSSGDLLLRWFGYSVVAVLLTLAVFGVFLFSSGVFLNNWTPGAIMIQFFLPLAMWIVAGYSAVVRFLSYLDLRIRQEGWEVELRLRAEAARLTSQLAGKLT